MPISLYQTVASSNRPVGTDFMDSTSPYYLVAVLQDLKATIRTQELNTPWVTLLGLTGAWTGGLTWTQTGGTTATIQGDQTKATGTGYLYPGQRVRAFVTAGTIYGQITAVSQGGGTTTVTFAWDSGVLDSGLSDIQTGGDPQAIPNRVWTQQYPATATVISNSGAAWSGTLVPAITAYSFLQLYIVQWNGVSQGSDTLSLNGLAAYPILKNDYVPLVAGDIQASQITVLAYDGAGHFLIINGLIGQHGTAALGTPGSGTFTVPTGVTQLIVDIYGAGGGGGGGSALTGGGGGGGGAHTRVLIVGLTPGASLAYTVGAAGTAGPGNGNGGNGGNSVFDGFTAYGGVGGQAGGTGGSGGNAQVPALGIFENEVGTAGGNGNNPSGGLYGYNFQTGGAGGGIGTGVSGNAGAPGLIIVTW